MPHPPTSSTLRQYLGDIRVRIETVLRPYRPELHYMRGPGPRWHARHGAVAAARGITAPQPYRPRRSPAP